MSFMGIIAIWYGLFYVVNNEQFLISSVRVSIDTQGTMYDYKPLVGYLTKDFKEMNKIMLPWYESKFKNYYISQYTWIKNISFNAEKNTLTIVITTQAPKAYVYADTSQYALLDGGFVSITTGLAISGVVIPKIQLLYAQVPGMTGLNSLFFSTPQGTFVKQFQLLQGNVGNYDALKRIPWADKIIVVKGDKEIYFDLHKNMIEQLDKYRLISWSGNVIWTYRKIDVGTMDDMIFLWK